MGLPIKIKLPNHFLEAEVRCGYAVSEKLKKIWAVELDLLSEFDRVCTKHRINYQVFAGTLLGAVRHKGFIPWDDDVDVVMTRDDYDRLLEVAPEFEFPYYLQTPYTDPIFFSPHARFRNSETTGAIKGQLDIRYNNGIYMDVFVMDGYTESVLGYKIQKKIIHLITGVITSKTRRIIKDEPLWKRIIRLMLRMIFSTASIPWLLHLRDWVVKFNDNNLTKDDRVSLLTHVNWFTERYWLRNGELQESRRYQFENINVLGPVDYDTVLRRPYGEYMNYPPVEERGKWHEGKILFEPDVPYKVFIERHLNGNKIG